jgi:hypothetical protein
MYALHHTNTLQVCCAGAASESVRCQFWPGVCAAGAPVHERPTQRVAGGERPAWNTHVVHVLCGVAYTDLHQTRCLHKLLRYTWWVHNQHPCVNCWRVCVCVTMRVLHAPPCLLPSGLAYSCSACAAVHAGPPQRVAGGAAGPTHVLFVLSP